LTDAVAVALMLGGMVGTGWSQATMGASWRIGVKVDEKTELVERGPFRWVRNPFFSSMLVSVGGMVLLLPNVVAIAAFASMFIAAELQVRFVEEPYLLGTHGERYASYTQRAGRFVPGHGKGLALPKGPR
jgi:protein-S-isoprenylcysteine O-methyltransferase Ste14